MRALLILPALLVASPALADASPRILRLYGEAVNAAGVDPTTDGMPKRFVIDAVLEDGDDGVSATIDEGWFAPLDGPAEGEPERVRGELEGTCIEERCALTADAGGVAMTITGDLLGKPGPSAAKFVLKQGDDTVVGQGTVRLTPITTDVPGLGRLAAADAITGPELSGLLAWTGHPTNAFDFNGPEIEDFHREALASWQAAHSRRGGGLVLVDDLTGLRAQAATAQAAAGWRDGYPSAWLRSLSVSSHPGERRYASDDGKVTLVIAHDPAIGDEAWDAMVDKLTSDDQPGESNGYTRVNDDMETSRTLDGVVTVSAFKNGDKHFHRMVLTYPESQAERWGPMASVLQFELRRTPD